MMVVIVAIKKDFISIVESGLHLALTPEKRISSRMINTSAIIERLPVGVLVCSIENSDRLESNFINRFAREIFDLKEEIELPVLLEDIWGAVDNQPFSNQVYEVFRTRRQSSFEWTIEVSDVERYISSQLIPMKDHEGKVYQVICTVEDQTAEKLAERNLLHHAFHDALTGQPNRVLFRNKLEEAVAVCQRDGSGHGVAVLILNIDRFQQINDSFGHSSGDRFLISMAVTLKNCIRGTDILARLSGDEFAILVSQCRDVDEVKLICERIHDAMKLPYDLDGNEVFTSVSIGVATTLTSSTHPEDLIRDADFAMHRAKSQGKARSEIHERSTHQRARNQFHLETELRRAVDRDELELYYQPIVGLDHGGVLGFEALTRWNHKDRGFVPPSEFIALAEETGIIVQLGRWSLLKACTEVKKWMDELGPEKARPVNVNVSGIQFSRDDVAKLIEDVLTETALPGFMLRVELTESAIMSNPGRISENLKKIKRLGVKVALDDFGAGYSSLNYLHQFPIDIIKIDRTFIMQMKTGNQTSEILRMVAMLADKLGHEIVGEGLEELEQINMLKDLNFDSGQGFYYSRPIPYKEATKLLTEPLPWNIVRKK